MNILILGEQNSTKTTPTAVMEKPFGSITITTDHPSQLPSFEPMDTKATTKTPSIDKPTKSATAAPTLISPQKPIIDDNKGRLPDFIYRASNFPKKYFPFKC